MRLFFILLSFCICVHMNAQEITVSTATGGEFFINQNESCLSEEDRSEIKKLIKEYKSQHPIKNRQSAAPAKLSWPIRKSELLNYNSYYGIFNFVDHDPVATGAQNGSSNLDYNCGMRSYDNADGYNHQGIDFYIYPFAWYLYENDMVEVIAAEAGTIIYKSDGYVDDHCSCFGTWNAVYIEHDDGSVAWYGHLKKK